MNLTAMLTPAKPGNFVKKTSYSMRAGRKPAANLMLLLSLILFFFGRQGLGQSCPVLPDITVSSTANTAVLGHVCPGVPVTFTVTNVQPNCLYKWSASRFGSSATLGTSCTRTYPSGSPAVQLWALCYGLNPDGSIIADANGNPICKKEKYIGIVINPSPDASITFQGGTQFESGVAQLIVNSPINLSATAGYDSYQWSWGGPTTQGNTTTSSNSCSNTYTATSFPGNFTLSLTVTKDGCTSTKTCLVNVDCRTPLPPTLLPSSSLTVCPDTPFQLTIDETGGTPGTTLTGPGGAVLDYYWSNRIEGSPKLPGGGPPPFTTTYSNPGIPNSGPNDITEHVYAFSHYMDATGASAVACDARKYIKITVRAPPAVSFTFANNIIKMETGGTVNVQATQAGYALYEWNWGETPPVQNEFGQSQKHIYEKPGTYIITLLVTDQNGCQNQVTKSIDIYDVLCKASFPDYAVPANGTNPILKNTFTGGMSVNLCNGVRLPFDCFSLSPDTATAANTKTITDGYAITFSDAFGPETAPGGNPFLAGYGCLRPSGTYTYAKAGNYGTAGPVSDGTTPLYAFNWQGRETNQYHYWALDGKAELYSPEGQALQERNALGIASAVKFGYGGTLPYLTAQNAEYNAVLFEGFESGQTDAQQPGLLLLEDGMTVSAADLQSEGHSGKKSVQLVNSGLMPTREFKNNGFSQGLLFRAWVKAGRTDLTGLAAKFTLWDVRTVNQPFQGVASRFIARTGEWALLEISVPATSLPAGTPAVPLPAFTPALVYSGTDPILVDDIRIQPVGAQASCYVYDPESQKLLTSFDDQHFGLFYQYNGEGKLVRKQVETVRGLQTIQETQYNTPKKNRPAQ